MAAFSVKDLMSPMSKIEKTLEETNKTTKDISFTVSSTGGSTVDAKDVVGGILIGVSVAVLLGVVAYFVVSKVKLDKKEKSYLAFEERKNSKKDKE